MMDTQLKSLLEYFSPSTAILLLILITLISLLLVNWVICNYDYFRGPGPWGIPILGFYPFLREDYPLQLTELAKKHGDVYLISIGGKRFLHLGSHQTLRECYVKKADIFFGRSQEFSLFNYVFGNGLLFLEGEPWREWRKFVMKSMKELGLGARSQLKDPSIESVKTVLKKLKESEGNPVDIAKILSTQCSKVIQNMLLGEEVSEDVIKRINKAYITSMAPMGGSGLLLVGNISRYLIVPRIKGYNKVFGAKTELYMLFAKILKDRKKNFDPNNPKDLIDHYLLTKKTKEDNNDPQARYFNDEAFLPTLLQIFGDGGSLTGVVLAIYVKFLSQREDIQNAMHDEIRQEIGTERLPTYEDRIKLPFVNAVIKEIERTSTFVSVVPSLVCSKKTTVSGVTVPKGTITLVNFYSIHNDANVYKDPERFDPTRFLTDKNTKRPREELPATFSVGKRACSGEDLVSTEIFLFLTALIQRFSLRLVYADTESKTYKENELGEAIDIQVTATPR